MEVESNSSPLYKPTTGKSEEGGGGGGGWAATPSTKHQLMRRRRRRTIYLAVVSLIFAVVLLFIILGFTVFKAKHPKVTIDSFSLDDFDLSLDIARVAVRLNLTLGVALSVKNPNKLGFQYRNGTSVLSYRGAVVGDAPVPAGKISGGETKRMDLELTVMADRFLTGTGLFSDVVAGRLPLSTETRLSGKVRVLFFKVHLVSSTSCDIEVSISNRNITRRVCNYKTKL